jgi:copper homeostasis protein CutC
LTSGRATNVEKGMANYAEIKDIFGEKLELMPGGGVNASNILNIAQTVQPSAIHFSAASILQAEKSKFSTDRMKIDEQKLVSMLKAIS